MLNWGLILLGLTGFSTAIVSISNYINIREEREILEMLERYGPRTESVDGVGTGALDTFYEINGHRAYTHIDGKPIE